MFEGNPQIDAAELERQKVLACAQDAASALAHGHSVFLRGFPALETAGLHSKENVLSLKRDAESLLVYLKRIQDAIDLGFTMEEIDKEAEKTRQLSRDARNNFEGQS